jgi:heme exporter protein B
MSAATGTPAPPALEPARQAPQGPRLLATVGALLRKELLVELRRLESVPAMTLFALSTFVVFHFALNRGSVEGDLAAGVLWVTLLFAAILGVNRLFVADADQGGFDAFLLAPVERTALLLAKALTLLAYLVALELIAVPAFSILLLGPPLGPALPGLLATLALADIGVAVIGTLVAALAVRTSARDLLGPPLGPALPGLLATLALADIGVAVIGTLVAALAVRTSARDLLGPLLALPLFVPIVIGAARCTEPLLVLGHRGDPPARWLATLGVYDLIFGLIAYALFDFLLED